MNPQFAIEVFLAVAAILLLGRDLRRAWRDQLRRPVSLLAAAMVAALLVGALMSGAHPSPGWLALPAAVLVWEVVGLHGGSLARGLVFLWQSRRREPRPWRVGDPDHYERRSAQRNRA